MWVHFADTSCFRGQWGLLVESGARATLANYFYLSSKKDVLRAYEWVWEQQMNLHITGTGPREMLKDSLVECDATKHLLSYAYAEDERNLYGPAWRELSGRARVLIDSGAFTAWNSGKIITPIEYGKWAISFRERWQDKLAFLRFINLDVIGDQEATWKNQAVLEYMGLDPIPVITRGASLDNIERAVEEYDYICFGGLVPLSRQRNQMRAWLDKCFSVVMRNYQRTGTLTRVHLLGVTQPWTLNRYPAYSSDSSTWTRPFRFSDAGLRAGLKVLPKYKEGAGAKAATIHTLRKELEALLKMEADATKLWEKRGIVFEEDICRTA